MKGYSELRPSERQGLLGASNRVSAAEKLLEAALLHLEAMRILADGVGIADARQSAIHNFEALLDRKAELYVLANRLMNGT